MQRLRMFDRSVDVDMDNAGLVGFGMMFGFWLASEIGLILALPSWMAQIGVSLFTMVAGAVVLHFVKRQLNRWWPHAAHRKNDIGE